MIESLNYGLTDCECGITVAFPEPPASMAKREEYFVYFSLESSLPREPKSTVDISPNAYTIGSSSFAPKTIVKVNSVHRGETQSLIKLTIKDKYNAVVHTNYLKIVCAPEATASSNGTILVGSGNYGSGGSLMNVASTSKLDVGMLVTGGDIDVPTYIKSIVNSTQIELTQFFAELANPTANYTFTRTTSCVDPDTLRRRAGQANYVVLDKDNNWTYTYNDKLIIQFIRQNPEDDSISVRVPAVNTSKLSGLGDKQDLPGVAIVRTSGRVTNDEYCIS